MVVSTTVRTRAHGDDPACATEHRGVSTCRRAEKKDRERTRLRHLVVHLAKRGGHLIRQSSRDNHDVGLPRTGTEHNTQTVLIVPGGSHVHHLDGTAGETCMRERCS